MSNKSQLQENNATLQFVLEQIQDKPTTEECMEAIEDLSEKTIPEYTALTMLASAWSGNVYSFENSYPRSTYNIEIYLDGDNITSGQKSAFGAAEIVGSLSGNTVKALGEVPTVNIPIIVKAVRK